MFNISNLWTLFSTCGESDSIIHFGACVDFHCSGGYGVSLAVLKLLRWCPIGDDGRTVALPSC
uniref:Uncharacterized protein n=1 Tax=Manihot esculenta TaxID=3983 RepID=A0A2C9VCU4_MANES